MKIEYIIHADERGGYWAEVPSIPGCVTEGRTLTELAANVKEAAMGCLEVILERMAREASRSGPTVDFPDVEERHPPRRGALSLSFRSANTAARQHGRTSRKAHALALA